MSEQANPFTETELQFLRLAVKILQDSNYMQPSQETVRLLATIDDLKADNDALKCALNDKGCDSAALLKLSRFLSESGQRDRDPSSVECVVKWFGDIRRLLEDVAANCECKSIGWLPYHRDECLPCRARAVLDGWRRK